MLVLLPAGSIANDSSDAPTLVDLTVIGAVEAPGFEPNSLVFTAGQPYVLVVTNDKPASITFQFNKFGQSVSTQLLQGTSAVSQDSILLLPNSKIVWHFIAQEAGEFVFAAVNAGLQKQGSAGKMVIQKIENEQEKSSSLNISASAVEPAKNSSSSSSSIPKRFRN